MAGGAEPSTELCRLAERIRPVAPAHRHTLPVLPPLRGLLPGGALCRGTTVAVTGAPAATSLALALAAGPSAAGSWVATVGVTDLGLAAAAELGVALERLVVVDRPPPSSWATVVATLVDAFDVVLLGPGQRVRATDARRLTARARERGSVLVVLDPAGGTGRGRVLEPEVVLTVTGARWEGLGWGYGHLRARRVRVEAAGRRAAARPRRADLLLGPDVALDVAVPGDGDHQVAPVVALRPPEGG